MTNLFKLIFPLTLGGLAAVGNNMYFARQFATESFVAFNTDVPRGTKIGPSLLKEVCLRVGETAHYDGTFLRWDDRRLAIGKKTRLGCKRNALILTQMFGRDEIPVQPGFAPLTLNLPKVSFSSLHSVYPGRSVRLSVRNANGRIERTSEQIRVLDINPLFDGPKRLSGTRLDVEIPANAESHVMHLVMHNNGENVVQVLALE